MNLGGVGEVVAGLYAPAALSYIGQEQANRHNEALQRESNAMSQASADKQMAFQADQSKQSMEFSDKQAQRQMDFQERMSNSAYQRSVADLKKAGINPMVAAMSSGASTPSGSAGSGTSGSGASGSFGAAKVESSLKAGLASAMEGAQMIMALRKQEADIGMQNAQKGLIESQKDNLAADTGKKRVESENYAPENKAKTKLWNFIEPYIDKAQEALRPGAKSKPEKTRKMSDDEIKELDKQHKIKMRLR